MLAYNTLVLRLLILSACSLFILGLLILGMALKTGQKTYYQRTREVTPKKTTSLARLMSTIIGMFGLIFLIVLLIFSTILLLKYISSSSIANIDASTNNTTWSANASKLGNITRVGDVTDINKKIQINNSAANSSTGEGSVPSTGSALEKAASDYGGYILAGLVILIVLLLILRKIDGSAAE
jgi:hypothetical protein